jgi:PAS domain S-box-containing protein
MKSQFRQLIESSPDAIVIIDPEGRILHANAQAESLFGYDRERLRDQPVQTLLPDQPLPHFSSDRPGQEKQASRQLELVGSRSDSSQFPAEVNVIPIKTAHGPAALVTVKDITEAQRAQFVLERSLEVLASGDRDLQLLLGHLVRAQEEERNRIAAGIHDDTIQVISAANLRLQQLRRRLQGSADVGDILDKLEEALQLSLSRLRQLIFDLRPPGLEDGTLAAALRTYLEQMRSETGIAYQLEDRLTTEIPVTTSVLIYRTAQEALVNVRKHSRATTVRVELAGISNGCLVRVADDGVGYNPADVENSPGHLGLVLMRERPQIAGGWCRIESAPGAGTTVEFWVPVDRPLARLEAAS